VTPGEHGGRGYGGEEQDDTSSYGPWGGYDGRRDQEWSGDPSWSPDQQAASGDQPWSGGHMPQPWSTEQSWGGASYERGWEQDRGNHQGGGYQGGGYQSGGYQGGGHQGGGHQGGAGYPYVPPGSTPYPDAADYGARGGHDPGWQASGWRDGDPDATASWHRPADERSPVGAEPVTNPRSTTGGGRHSQDSRGGRGSRDSGGRRGKERRRGLPLWQELPLLLVIAFCLALLVRTFLFQAFFIPSGSMEETLLAGDRVLVNKVVYHTREPARGEVVVFRGTDAWSPQHAIDSDIGMFSRASRFLGDLVGVSRPTEKDYIKRIVGLPGDRVSCCDVDGRVFVNGHPLDEEDYVVFNAPLDDGPDGAQDCFSRRFDEIVVEPGQMFVLGDQRANSQDSRCQGQVPLDNVIGRAFVIVWPSGRWAALSAPGTFDAVPSASGEYHMPAGGMAGETALVVPMLLSAAATLRTSRRVPGVTDERDTVSSRGD
jgi:signal peptidase I